MSCSNQQGNGFDATQTLIEELIRTAFALQAVLATLLEDIPPGAFPGEDNGAVLIEIVSGNCYPAVDAVGESECRAAIELIRAVRGRLLDDLRTAAQLASGGANREMLL